MKQFLNTGHNIFTKFLQEELSILVAKISWTGLRIDLLMNSEVGHMEYVINFEREMGSPHDLKVAFNNFFRLEIITDTDN